MSDTTRTVLTINEVTKWFPVKKGQKLFASKKNRQYARAVDGVSLTVGAGEILGIIGESGCGKSTLGSLIAALEMPTLGSIMVEGTDIQDFLKKDSKGFREIIQIIFQNPFDTFPPGMTVQRILMRALKLHDIGGSQEERVEICVRALEDAGLNPAKDFLPRFPHELSGGQLQRISIIRSMLLKPKLLIADEPVSMLDVSIRADIINMLLDLVRNNGMSLIFISHDIATTRYISDRIAVMYLGRIVESGVTDDVISAPQHPYTRALISNCSAIDPKQRRESITIHGEPPSPVGEKKGCFFAPRCFMATARCLTAYPERVNISDSHYLYCWNRDNENKA